MLRLTIGALLIIFMFCPTKLSSQEQLSYDDAESAFFIDVSVYRDLQKPNLDIVGTENIRSVFEQQGGYNSEQIESLDIKSSGKLTRHGIMMALEDFMENKFKRNNRLIFYFRGYASKENDGYSYLFPNDISSKNIARTGISDFELNKWLSQVKAENLVLILDCYQYGNRQPTFDYIEAIDNRAIIVITHPPESKIENPQFLSEALKNDEDGDRRIVVKEVYNSIKSYIKSGRVSMRGDDSLILINLPSTITILTDKGAEISLDGKLKGQSPQTFEPTKKTYTISVRKNSYFEIEDSIEIDSLRGKKKIKDYQLRPISVYGEVKDIGGNPRQGVKISIKPNDNKEPYEKESDAQGKFLFDEWEDDRLLVTGEKYQIIASDDKLPKDISKDFDFEEKDNGNDVGNIIPQPFASEPVILRKKSAGDKEVHVSNTIEGEIRITGNVDLIKKVEAKLDIPGDFLSRECSEENDIVIGSSKVYRFHYKIPNDNSYAGEWKITEVIIKDYWEASKNCPVSDKKAILIVEKRFFTQQVITITIVIISVLVFSVILYKLITRFRQISNPYLIEEKSVFFKRRDVIEPIKIELENIFNGSSDSSAILLYGPRGIGKTSSLDEIKKGILGDEYLPVYINMQGMMGSDLSSYFQQMLEENIRSFLSERKPEAGEQLIDENKLDEFDTFLNQVGKSFKILLLLDEYETIYGQLNEHRLKFADYLKALLESKHKISAIFAGASTPDEIGATDYLPNLTFQLVRCLKEEDTKHLITQPNPDKKSPISYNEEAIEEIFRLTGGHPALLEAFGRRITNLLNRKEKRSIATGDIDEIRAIIIIKELSIINRISELTNLEKIILSFIATEREEYLSMEYIEASVKEKFDQFQIPQKNFVNIEKNLKRLSDFNGILERQGNDYGYSIDLLRYYYRSDNFLYRLLLKTFSKINQNPYTKKENFYGRELEMEDIRSYLDIKRNILITGPSRIGKSFLIRHIYRLISKEVQKNNIFLLMNLEETQALTESKFFIKLSKELKERLGDEVPNEGLNNRTFRSLLSKFRKTGRHLILFIDPLEPIMAGDSENYQFLGYLRAIGGNGLSYIITSSKSQSELNVTLPTLVSAFINTFAEIQLIPFNYKEALQIIESQNLKISESDIRFILDRVEVPFNYKEASQIIKSQNLKINASDIRFILDLVEVPPLHRYPENIYHPFCLSIACFYLYEYKAVIKEGNLDIRDYKSIKEVYLKDPEISEIPDLVAREKGGEYA